MKGEWGCQTNAFAAVLNIAGIVTQILSASTNFFLYSYEALIKTAVKSVSCACMVHGVAGDTVMCALGLYFVANISKDDLVQTLGKYFLVAPCLYKQFH